MDIQPVVQLVGKREQRYVGRDDGRLRRWRTLYVAYPCADTSDGSDGDDDPDGPGETMEGVQAEALACPRGVDYGCLVVGGYYTLVYELRQSKLGMMAYLTGLSPLDVTGGGGETVSRAAGGT